MLKTVPLDKNLHDRKSFDCGDNDLNIFFAQQASSSDQRSLTKTYVVVDAENPARIYGFYTLAFSSVSVPPNFPRLKYPMPAPALRLLRMGVDTDYQGNNIGAEMLLEVIRKTAATITSESIAPVIGLFVDAKPKAVGFYKKYGLVASESRNQDKNTTMFMSSVNCAAYSQQN
jgi:GNAT superfamily N-acetyltransferase